MEADALGEWSVEGTGGGAAVVAGEAETVMTDDCGCGKQLRRSGGRGAHLAVGNDARRVVGALVAPRQRLAGWFLQMLSILCEGFQIGPPLYPKYPVAIHPIIWVTTHKRIKKKIT